MAADLHAEEPRLLVIPHRADDFWEVEDTSALHCRRGDGGIWARDRDIDPRVRQLLLQVGFYGVSRIGDIRLDHSLITALVDRWRQETHTFHMSVGETTVTLQDVAVLFGLPVDGLAVICHDSLRTREEWQDLVFQQLGVLLPDEFMVGARVRVSWFRQHFTGALPKNAPAEDIQRRARALILWLTGGFLMPDKSQNLIKLMYLPLLQDLRQVRSYSWGAATLAFLYRHLCHASRPGESQIAGPLVLLQVWAWERFPRIAPGRRLEVGPGQAPIEHRDDVLLIGPWGCRWRVGYDLEVAPIHVVVYYRDMFDRMTAVDIVWMSYGAADEIIEGLPDYCTAGRDVWLARIPLICVEVVEWHLPDRVLRQFGRVQPVPQHPDTNPNLHAVDRRGRVDTDWREEHADWVALWDRRMDDIVDASHTSVPLDYHGTYMTWFCRVSRLLLTHPIQRWAHGFVGGAGVLNVLERYVADAYCFTGEWVRGHSPRDPTFPTMQSLHIGAYTALTNAGRQYHVEMSTAPSSSSQPPPMPPSSSQPPPMPPSMGSPSTPSAEPVSSSPIQFSPLVGCHTPSIPSSSTIRERDPHIPDMTQSMRDTIAHAVRDALSQSHPRPPLPVCGRVRGRRRGGGRARATELSIVPVANGRQASPQLPFSQVATQYPTASTQRTVDASAPMASTPQGSPVVQSTSFTALLSPGDEVPQPFQGSHLHPAPPTHGTDRGPEQAPRTQRREVNVHFVRQSKRERRPPRGCGMH